MLKTMNNVKESEKQLANLKNRVNKLLKEKEDAERQIKNAKARVTFIHKVSNQKESNKDVKKTYFTALEENRALLKALNTHKRRQHRDRIQQAKSEVHSKRVSNRDEIKGDSVL